MSILGRIKSALSTNAQRALGLDAIRSNLQVALERLEKIHEIEGKLSEIQSRNASMEARTASIDARGARLTEQFDNLKNFLTWYSNRVEPWFWTGNFSQADPEEELAGFLFNFLPGRSLVDVCPSEGHFAETAAAAGYAVFSVKPPNIVASLVASKSLPPTVDFLRIAAESFGLDVVQVLDWIKPPVVQTEFSSDCQASSQDERGNAVRLPPTEIISEMRKREYYWNLLIFRTEAEGFIRMATNLASVPTQAWGGILFFRDHQLFLKAFHWCKTTLPRFRAAPLSR